MMHGSGYNMFGFGFFELIILIGVIVLVIWVLKSGTIDKGKQTSTPLDILKQRLAKGEISEEEYERLKNKLEEE
ncbi:hypothetical protein BN1058_02261 [Paraliobacillus sp. PM-2]|uniref:SHOCT domain-containing protein n=1 Tax=Paraliobacillus sp. PM-2 TaxID=1462524 RepID=UPI00061C182F|nr:SHOCT domain-containing protein [Paraliobacillus sp. PM-2]CQR47927.1 hypothetical protein BN1058_02261 [Paraliobacillus sp. PM-2]